MERGFLDSGDKNKKKKKKEGVSSMPSDGFPILSGIAKHVKNIEGKTNVPKSILKKAVRNVVNDAHEVVKPSHDGGVLAKCGSFASLLKPNDATNKVHFCTLVNEERVESVDCVLPKAAAVKVKGRYDNSIVGFFLGKDPSFLDGLSLLATQIGKTIMLDAFTSSMYVESWGRISFARALIEIDAAVGLKKEVIMAIPEEEGDGHIKEVVRVEYEWKPPHCVDCKSFGHDTSLYPKRVCKEVPNNSARDAKATVMEENDDGFTEVKSRKKKKGADSRSFGGLRLNKPNSKVIWQQKKGGDTKGGSKSASPSVSTYDSGNGVLNPGYDHVNSVLDKNKDTSKPSSSNSGYGDGHKDKNVSSPLVLKKRDVINESDTTYDKDGFTSFSTSL
nr:hypothetical protein [Tanacetum cinerariifolium]